MSKEIKKLSSVISAEDAKMLRAAAHYNFCGIEIEDMDAEDRLMIIGLLLLKVGELEHEKKATKPKIILPPRFGNS